MTTDELIERLRAGLDGVTPGPWEIDDLAERRVASFPVRAHGKSIAAVWARARGGAVTAATIFEGKRNAAHIALCSPDNICALLDRIASLEAERDDARRQRDEIGRAWDEADARAKEAEVRAASLEAALDSVQEWVRQKRIELQPIDPDFHPKYETLKAVGAKIRDEKGALSSSKQKDGE